MGMNLTLPMSLMSSYIETITYLLVQHIMGISFTDFVIIMAMEKVHRLMTLLYSNGHETS